MKRYIKGMAVEMPRGDLMEKVYEDLAHNNNKGCSVSMFAETDREIRQKIERYVRTYHVINKQIPFPLSETDLNVRYAMVAECIRNKLHDEIKMWVDNALYIKVGDKMALRLVGDQWDMVSVHKDIKDNTNLERYTSDIGYEDYCWVGDRIKNGEATDVYRKKFMGALYKLCNEDDNIFREELLKSNIFTKIPGVNSIDSKILKDINDDAEYTLDIYKESVKETDKKMWVCDITGDDAVIHEENTCKDIYNFDGYVKEHGNPIRKIKADGLVSVFVNAVSERNISENDNGDFEFRGIVNGNRILYQCNDTLYTCRKDRYEKGVEVLCGINILGYWSKYMLCERREIKENGVCKTFIYAVDSESLKVGLCEIRYEYK